MHVIITVNPDLAGMATEAMWIMVPATFAVVHGKTNEWKLLIWLHGLEKHVVFQILLGFPYLETAAEIEQFKTFCANSTNPKVKAWWAHKISYPWLLPSLNRSLTGMPNRHWDLTPGDTNPMEGSHAQDNQVSGTNRSILGPILLARQYDQNKARVLKISIESGVLENGNNSLQARFAASARRHARARVKQAESVELDGGKQLKAKLKAATQREKAQELEIQQLRSRINALASRSAVQSQPQLEASSRRCMSTHLFV
ncbi:hypothetical protein B0H13DRAFT_1586797 [Mycena leptocephala]|nr:hypothetical protein B0H13DRAFT_1586797 [Mycena leptocephala]